MFLKIWPSGCLRENFLFHKSFMKSLAVFAVIQFFGFETREKGNNEKFQSFACGICYDCYTTTVKFLSGKQHSSFVKNEVTCFAKSQIT